MISHPVPFRGASRNVPARGGLRWTRMVLLTRAPEADERNRVVLTPPTSVSSLRSVPQVTVAIEQGSPGRPRISRKPLRRECRVIPV